MLIAHWGFPVIFFASDMGVEMAQMEIRNLFSSQGWKPFSSAVAKLRAPLNSENKTLTERVACLFGRKATYILAF